MRVVMQPMFPAELVRSAAGLFCEDPGAASFGNASEHDALAALIRHWHIGPPLWLRLRHRQDLPPVLRSMLRQEYLANVERNRQLRDGLLELLALLNGRGIIPMLLKGGCQLIDPPSGHAGLRYMNDIDLLLPPGQDHATFALLTDLGFTYESIWIRDRCHQWPKLTRPDGTFSVEVHRLPWAGANEQHAFALWTHAAPASGIPATVYLPSLDHRLLHNAVHGFTDWPFSYVAAWQSEAFDRVLGCVDLKQLYDFVDICRQRRDQIFWPELLSTAERFGSLAQLQQWAALAKTLFDLGLPAGVGRWDYPGDRARGITASVRRLRVLALKMTAESLAAIGVLDSMYRWKTTRWLQRRGM